MVVVLSAGFIGASVSPVLGAGDKRAPGAGDNDGRTKEARRTNTGPFRAEWEKRREELEKMTPEEREAKRKELKERLEKRISELRLKESAGTLTSQEKRELERREQVLKRFEQAVPGGPKGEAPRRREPAAPAPPEK